MPVTGKQVGKDEKFSFSKCKVNLENSPIIYQALDGFS